MKVIKRFSLLWLLLIVATVNSYSYAMDGVFNGPDTSGNYAFQMAMRYASQAKDILMHSTQ